MQLLTLDGLQPGMRVARSLIRPDGQVLLSAGITLREENIAALRRQKVEAIYVADDSFESVDVPDAVRREVELEARQSVVAALANLPVRSRLRARRVTHAVESIMDEVLQSRATQMALLDVRGAEDNLLQHSAGTGILSVLIGIELGLERARLYELGAGALLHDVGKVMVPRRILDKPDQLTAKQRQVMETHTSLGFELLRHRSDFPQLSALVAHQHHERLDGSGYPLGLRQSDIHPYATIAAVADVYDAMTAPRPYRGALHPAAALHWVRQQSGIQFSELVVRSLARIVAPYPVATMVEVVRDPHGEPVHRLRELDLARHPEIRIRRHVGNREFATPSA